MTSVKAKILNRCQLKYSITEQNTVWAPQSRRVPVSFYPAVLHGLVLIG
jgi:hypothetical protein